MGTSIKAGYGWRDIQDISDITDILDDLNLLGIPDKTDVLDIPDKTDVLDIPDKTYVLDIPDKPGLPDLIVAGRRIHSNNSYSVPYMDFDVFASEREKIVMSLPIINYAFSGCTLGSVSRILQNKMRGRLHKLPNLFWGIDFYIFFYLF